MTQDQLAAVLNTSQATVSRWFSGKRFPKGLYKKLLQEQHPEIYKLIVQIHEAKNETNS